VLVQTEGERAPAETFAVRAQSRSEALRGHMCAVSHSVR
jgi:hypothetical protein